MIEPMSPNELPGAAVGSSNKQKLNGRKQQRKMCNAKRDAVQHPTKRGKTKRKGDHRRAPHRERTDRRTIHLVEPSQPASRLEAA